MQDRPLATTEQTVAERVGDELVVYHKSTHAAHALSAEAAAVWESCDGQRTTEEIAHDLGFAISIVERAVEELERCALITNPGGFSRRELTERAAAAAGAAFAAPMIYSMAVPTAAWAGSSCIGNTATGCTATSGQTGTSSACGCSASNGHCYLPPGTGKTPVCAPAGCAGELASAPHCTAAPSTAARDTQDCCSGCCYNSGTTGSPHYICAGTMTC